MEITVPTEECFTTDRAFYDDLQTALESYSDEDTDTDRDTDTDNDTDMSSATDEEWLYQYNLDLDDETIREIFVRTPVRLALHNALCPPVPFLFCNVCKEVYNK